MQSVVRESLWNSVKVISCPRHFCSAETASSEKRSRQDFVPFLHGAAVQLRAQQFDEGVSDTWPTDLDFSYNDHGKRRCAPRNLADQVQPLPPTGNRVYAITSTLQSRDKYCQCIEYPTLRSLQDAFLPAECNAGKGPLAPVAPGVTESLGRVCLKGAGERMSILPIVFE